MIGCWAEKPKHQHKSSVRSLTRPLLLRARLSRSLTAFLFNPSHTHTHKRALSAHGVCTAYRHQRTNLYMKLVFYVLQTGGPYVHRADGAVVTVASGKRSWEPKAAKWCSLCHFSLFLGFFVSLCACTAPCVLVLFLSFRCRFFIRFSSAHVLLSSCVRLFILRAFVRPHLMSIVSILNFIDSMFVRNSSPYTMHKNDCIQTRATDTHTEWIRENSFW